MSFSERVKELRKERGLSQEELGGRKRAIGLTKINYGCSVEIDYCGWAAW